MKIEIASIHVADQQRALEFYTDKLGFEVKTCGNLISIHRAG